MPNRIIKESICTSENIDQLSPWAEIAFYRLMVNCDDYGRMDARPKIIKSRLFPLKDASESDVQSWLKEMADADLIIIYHHDGKPYLQMKTWDRHQQVRAKRSKYPSADEITCNQLISEDSKCPRNPIQSESLSESLSESKAMIPDADAHRIQTEHNQLLDAATSAGFKCTDSEIAHLLRFYADYGLSKVLEGIKSCVQHSAPNLAYLGAVLKGSPKKAKTHVVAQEYEQRDYTEMVREQEEAQRNHILERLKARNAV